MLNDLNSQINHHARRIAAESGEMLLLPYFLEAVTTGASIAINNLMQETIPRGSYETTKEVAAES